MDLDWGTGSYERTAEQLLPAAQVLVDAAAVQPGERVLDLGCGTGNAALLAAARGAAVVAVDPSERLLSVTREAAASQGLDVVTERGDAAAIPAPDASVDCLLSSFALIFAPDPAAAAAEIGRVLAPGGRGAFSAWFPGGPVGTYVDAAGALVREALGAPPPPPGFGWHDKEAVAALFAPVGLRASVLGTHEISFTAESPEAYFEAESAAHPMAVASVQVLERAGTAEQARAQLQALLRELNEDPAAFRLTSRYVVLGLTR
jgi:SAM-dependent methyltransferase